MTAAAPEDLKAKLTKLLALARAGVGGEKENAGRLLTRLLTQHGLTLADLEREDLPTETRWFMPRTVHERVLLKQIVGHVIKSRDVETYSYRGSKSMKRGYDLTAPQYLEVTLRWDAFKAAWAKEQDRLLVAFIHSHRLYSGVPSTSEEESTLSAEDMAAIMSMAAGMSPVAFHKALPRRAASL